MKNYLGYIRVSTPRQGEGVSLQEQRSAIEAHARTHGLHVAGWFEEQESASKQGRRVFNEVLTQLEKGRAAGVIIHKIDRSARHLKDWAWLGELIDRGVDVRFAHENLDLTSRGGRLTADLLAVLAADYSRNLRDEVKKGLYGRLKQGFYPWRAPVGYLDQGGGRAKAVDPIKGPLVRLAFELYATRRYTLETLRFELARRGLRRPNGDPMSRNAMHLVLNNPFYIGIIKVQATRQTFRGAHTPLVRAALFDQVQAVLAGRTNTRVIVHDYAFRRLITCQACGRSLSGERHGKYVYYRCHTRTCRRTSLSEEDIFRDLRAFFQLIAFTPQDLQDMRDFVEADRGNAAASAEAERVRATRAIGLCDERLGRLTDAIVDGLIDKEAFETRKAALLRERQAHLDQLEHPPEGTPAERLLKKFEIGNAAYLSLESSFPEEIRQSVESTSSKLAAQGKELMITPLFPFFDLAKQRLVSSGGAYCNVLRNGSTICLTNTSVPILSTTVRLNLLQLLSTSAPVDVRPIRPQQQR